MNERQRYLEAALGYLGLGMHLDAWGELESLPPELRADDVVLEFRISGIGPRSRRNAPFLRAKCYTAWTDPARPLLRGSEALA